MHTLQIPRRNQITRVISINKSQRFVCRAVIFIGARSVRIYKTLGAFDVVVTTIRTAPRDQLRTTGLVELTIELIGAVFIIS